MQKASQLGKPGFWRLLQKETKVNEDLNGANRLAENWRWKAGDRWVFQSAFIKTADWSVCASAPLFRIPKQTIFNKHRNPIRPFDVRRSMFVVRRSAVSAGSLCSL
jgi:hypothetical protein